MEMTEDLEQIENLLSLFEDREAVMRYTTNQIFDAIAPTVLESLSEVLEIPMNEIGWESVNYSNGILLLDCDIWIDSKNSSDFIKYVFKDSINQDPHLGRAKIKFPIAFAFKPKEFIIDFLMNNVQVNKNDQLVDLPRKIKDNLQRFDNNMLTEEQIKQLELFNSIDKGAKH